MNKNKKLISGFVVSDTMNKTIVVKVEKLKKHLLLKKYHKRATKYKVHDENNIAKIGDLVDFYQVKPLSKTKSFMLSSIQLKK